MSFPKGTRRQINESRYAAVARSAATWQSVLLNAALKHTAVQQRNGLPRPVTSVTGLAMTEVFSHYLVFSLLALSQHRQPLSRSAPAARCGSVTTAPQLRYIHGVSRGWCRFAAKILNVALKICHSPKRPKNFSIFSKNSLQIEKHMLYLCQ